MRYFEVTAADTSVMSQIRDRGEKFNSFNLCILTFLDLVLITLDCMAIQKNSTNMRTKIINTVRTKQIRRQTHTHTGFEEGKSPEK